MNSNQNLTTNLSQKKLSGSSSVPSVLDGKSGKYVPGLRPKNSETIQPTHPRYIFLDVDGVLNPAFDVKPDEEIEPQKVKFLKQIVDKTGAKIVVHSSWKYHDFMLNKLRDALAKSGLEIHDVTPTIYGKDTGRENEILQYIKSILGSDEYELSYVVLDDWDMFRTFGEHMLTTFEPKRQAFGLDQVFVDRAVEILSH